MSLSSFLQRRTRKAAAAAASADPETLLAICVAADDTPATPPLAADRFLLAAASECARGLPADADSWDLSRLLVDGQPVRREVVVAWLHAATSAIHDEPFGGAPQQDPPIVTTAAGLAAVLAFADAVGSSGGVVRAVLWQSLNHLHFRVAAGGGEGAPELQLEPDVCYAWSASNPMQLLGRAGRAGAFEVATLPSTDAKAALVAQFAAQLEALLYLGHRLELRSLTLLANSAVRNNTAGDRSLLSHASCIIDPRVVSARVLEAATGPGLPAQSALINGILSQPCTFAPGGRYPHVLKPLNLTEQQKQPIKFNAEVLDDDGCLLGMDKGQQVSVSLQLLSSSGPATIKLGEETHELTLFVGRRLGVKELDALLAAHDAAADADVKAVAGAAAGPAPVVAGGAVP